MTNILTGIKVGIIDNNVEERNELAMAIENCAYSSIAFTLSDGRNAVEMIVEHKPDVLIIDDALPFMNGIEVLSKFEELNCLPYIIYTLSVNNNLVINQATKLGAREIVLKPYKAMSLINKICELYRNEYNLGKKYNVNSIVNDSALGRSSYGIIEQRKQMKQEIAEAASIVLYRSNISRKYNGFNYIVYAVQLMYFMNDSVYTITKDIYDAIEDRFEASYVMVESSIRHCIKKGWEKYESARGDSDSNGSIYTSFIKKPSNQEFLERLTVMVYDILANRGSVKSL